MRSNQTFILLILLLPSLATAQQYFKVINEPDNYFNQKIAHFPNGDILLVDSSLEALRIGNGGKIFATRIDRCGNTIWSKTYERESYLEFKDIAINEAGEVFIYGSEYTNLQEFIFIVKLDEDGQLLKANLLLPQTVDHFAHTIHLKENNVLLYGFGLDFNTLRQGYIVLLDDKLNFLWGKTFEPFESTGDAIFVEDGILLRSGQYHIKLNLTGDIVWALELDASDGIRTIQGPVEVSGGYIFEAKQSEFSFLYKLNQSGRLVWKSAAYKSTGAGAGISVMKNQDIAFTYLYPENNKTYPNFAVLSPNGDLLTSQQFNTPTPLLTKTVYQTIFNDEILAVAGNANPLANSAEISAVNFLLQFSLETPLEDCFSVRDYLVANPNDLTLNFIPLEIEAATTIMEQFRVNKINISNYDDFVSDYCGGGTTIVPIDTLIDCNNDWEIQLPEGFSWEDQTKENPRIIRFSGTYRARNTLNCAETIIHDYTLEKPSCDCKVYLPNAFSPNGDNVNDELLFFTDCNLDQATVKVYNRWGQQVFYQSKSDISWDGISRGKQLPPGVYIVQVIYEWLDDTGMRQTRSIVQDVTITR